jgi:hypothetical protein
MISEDKFRDPEIHCSKFGDLSDTSCQVQEPPVNFYLWVWVDVVLSLVSSLLQCVSLHLDISFARSNAWRLTSPYKHYCSIFNLNGLLIHRELQTLLAAQHTYRSNSISSLGRLGVFNLILVIEQLFELTSSHYLYHIIPCLDVARFYFCFLY